MATNHSNQNSLKNFKKDAPPTSLILVHVLIHIANNTFLEGTKCLKDNVNVDQFAIDLHFFFKLSAVRREDYRVPYKLTDMTICLQKYFLSFAYLTWRVKCCVYNTYLLRLKLIMELMLDHLCSKCMPFRGSTLMKQCLLFLEAPLNIS